MRILLPTAVALVGFALFHAVDVGVEAPASAVLPPALTVAGGGGAGMHAAGGDAQSMRSAYAWMARVGTNREVDAGPLELSSEDLDDVVFRYCVACHNDQLLTGNLSLYGFSVAEASANWETAEKMITKLRAGQMPPSGMVRPGGDTLQVLVTTLERTIDQFAATTPQPGEKSFQRLNRAEYRAAIKDLFTLEVDPSAWLPPDVQSDGFDNVADAQPLSTTLLDGYLRAAAAIARLAVGDPAAAMQAVPYRVPRLTSQRERVQGAPVGTRGGVSLVHHFPVDGEYSFLMEFYNDDVGDMHGAAAPFDEQIEVSINGEPVALHDVDRFMTDSDPRGVTIETEPVFVQAGPQRVTAAFIQQWDGPVNDILAPPGHSIVDVWVGKERGITNVTHLQELTITGPLGETGFAAAPRDTPSRERIFTCRPDESNGEEARACAEQILRDLGTQAYRRPLDSEDMAGLMAFYDRGASTDGFEEGIRVALEALLASPFFVFRFEEEPIGISPGEAYPLGAIELASRLSFFLWGQLPDERLRALAAEGALSDPEVLDEEVTRMLADPRAEALATRFAAQWLRLAGINAIQPDYTLYPDYDQQLADAMRRETELLFYHLVKEDRSVRELFEADYTFVNERLARHYGIDGVIGDAFQKVSQADERRRGILGHGSVLTLTSHGGRTSPVDRGKWVLEVLIGTPPPPPPPDVNTELAAVEDEGLGRLLTMRERLQMHRANPACSSCHNMIDPVGLALENFDVVGQWRIRDGQMGVDAETQLWDGTPVNGPADLRNALLDNWSESLYRSFAQNLMTYALGRRIEYFDGPTIRTIVREAESEDYRISRFIRGVVHSPAFQMREAGAVAELDDGS